jgi:hypothetical protein
MSAMVKCFVRQTMFQGGILVKPDIVLKCGAPKKKISAKKSSNLLDC